jgi:hypothetical protein
MAVAAALRCAGDSALQPEAIITATGLGCLHDTEKFLNAIDDNELQLNPTPFIQSTFNTAGAQIALMLGCRGYNSTYAHRGFSFESALLDAMIQIDEGASGVLVGCFDETTDAGFEIMRRLGFWRDGFAAGEGAAFFMLGGQPAVNRPAVRISGVHFFKGRSDAPSIDGRITDFLASVRKTAADIDLLVSGNGDSTCPRPLPCCLADKPYCLFKDLCGEYPTASGFAVYLTFKILESRRIPHGIVCHGRIPTEINNVLIHNHYQNTNHSLIFLEIPNELAA